jgi:predicted enzyme related to lactoylglutathione lyase
MPTTISHVTFDCHDTYAQARFWCAVFEVGMDPEDLVGDPESIVRLPSGPVLLFELVPEGKTVKNRVHLDLSPPTTRDEEVLRLEGLGATIVGDERRPDGTGWVVMTDPEGNEFCVERSSAERERGARADTVTATGIRSGP